MIAKLKVRNWIKKTLINMSLKMSKNDKNRNTPAVHLSYPCMLIDIEEEFLRLCDIVAPLVFIQRTSMRK